MVAQTVKCLPTTWETRVQFLGQKDPLEKEMATHSNTVAWKIPWTEEPGRLQSMGSQRVGHDWANEMNWIESKCSPIILQVLWVLFCDNPYLDFIFNLRKVKVKSLSLVRLFVTPWTVTYHAPPSMGFSRQEYWSRLPFPSPGDIDYSAISLWASGVQETLFT